MKLEAPEIRNALKEIRKEILAVKTKELNDPKIPLNRTKFLSALVDATFQMESDYKHFGSPRNMIEQKPAVNYQALLFGEPETTQIDLFN